MVEVRIRTRVLNLKNMAGFIFSTCEEEEPKVQGRERRSGVQNYPPHTHTHTNTFTILPCPETQPTNIFVVCSQPQGLSFFRHHNFALEALPSNLQETGVEGRLRGQGEPGASSPGQGPLRMPLNQRSQAKITSHQAAPLSKATRAEHKGMLMHLVHLARLCR